MKPPQPTRVPEVIDALLDTLGAIEGVTVLDGPTVKTPRSDCIQVAAGDDGVVATLDERPGLRTTYVEVARIVCVVWSWSGSTTMKPRRDRCRDILAAIDTALRADPDLGGVVDRVTLGQDWSWQQQLTDRGAAVSVGFTIDTRTNI